MVPRLFTVLQILLLGVALAIGVDALAVWRRSPLPPPVHPEPVATRAAPAYGQRPRQRYESYQTIASRDLFHTARSTPSASTPVADLRQLEPTRLDLLLWGTIAGGSRDAWAVIEDPQHRSQQLYRIGDVVSDAVIKLILRKQVVLTVNGKDEVLLLSATATPGASPGQSRLRKVPVRPVRGAAAMPAPAPDVRKVPPPAPPVETEPGESPRPEADAVVLNPGMLKPVAELFEGEAEALFEAAAPGDGQPGGIRIAAGSRGQVLRQFGLRDGDLITAIDDAPVATAEEVVDLFRGLSADQEATITVRRGQQTQTVRYRLQGQ